MHPDLGLLFGWKHVHHPVDGLGGGTGVQRAEHQVSCFRSTDSELNRFQIPHFTHQDHVRVFAESGSQGIGEAACVFVELALVHQALIAGVDEFDRILDREDVLTAAVVDVIQQGRQRRGLAGTGGAGHQHQSPRTPTHLQHHRRKIELFHTGNFAAQGPEAGGIAAPLPVNVDPEAGHPSQAVGAVQLPVLFQGLALAVVQHRENQPVAVLLFERVIRHRSQFTAEPSVGRLAGGEMQVAAAGLHQLLHQILDHQGHGVVLSGCGAE